MDGLDTDILAPGPWERERESWTKHRDHDKKLTSMIFYEWLEIHINSAQTLNVGDYQPLLFSSNNKQLKMITINTLVKRWYHWKYKGSSNKKFMCLSIAIER